MKKKASKAIALSLVGVSMVTPILNTVSAMEPTPVKQEVQNDILANLGVKTLKDTNDEKVVEVIDGNTVSTSTYNKNDDSVKLVVKENGIVVQDEIIKETESNGHNRVRRSSSIVSMQCLYSKLKYSINMKSWTITNSKGAVKKKPETKSHVTNLYRFKDAVRACRQDENTATVSLAGFQASVLGAAITGALSGGVGSIVAILGSIGAPISAATSLWSASQHQKDADRYFALL